MHENLSVIEDCSPYFIRFKFDQLEKIISIIKSEESNAVIKFEGTYVHKDFPQNVTEKIVNCLPKQFQFNFITSAIFETPPGGGSGIHKDGKDNRISFNIPIQINDNKCITYWYNDEEQFDNLPLKGDLSYTRNVYSDNNNLSKFIFSKSMMAQENEMLLFNTDIFHSWKNYSSEHVRKMFVLRIKDRNTVFFDDAKKILGF
jgi:hypothetical protein